LAVLASFNLEELEARLEQERLLEEVGGGRSPLRVCTE